MELYLIRHAIAEPASHAIKDRDRALTPEGRRRFDAGVAGLKRLEVRLDVVLASPWLRAQQTAELLGPIAQRINTEPALAADPGASLLAGIDGQQAAGAESVALVGHEPWMGELLALLLHGQARLSGAFPFKKGGVAWVSGEPRLGACTLRALWTPKSLWSMAARPPAI